MISSCKVKTVRTKPKKGYNEKSGKKLSISLRKNKKARNIWVTLKDNEEG